MAHFAELDNDYNVVRVIVVDNKDILDENGNESEAIGIDFCTQLLGGIWKQTSYNANFRKNYAGIGYTYDQGRDAFIPPKMFSKWILNEDTCQWESPVPRPDEPGYFWNDESGEWELVS
jgi:hypothetical protein